MRRNYLYGFSIYQVVKIYLWHKDTCYHHSISNTVLYASIIFIVKCLGKKSCSTNDYWQLLAWILTLFDTCPIHTRPFFIMVLSPWIYWDDCKQLCCWEKSLSNLYLQNSQETNHLIWGCNFWVKIVIYFRYIKCFTQNMRWRLKQALILLYFNTGTYLWITSNWATLSLVLIIIFGWINGEILKFKQICSAT